MVDGSGWGCMIEWWMGQGGVYERMIDESGYGYMIEWWMSQDEGV